MAAGADERSLIALPTDGWSQPMIFWTTLCLKSVTKKTLKKGTLSTFGDHPSKKAKSGLVSGHDHHQLQLFVTGREKEGAKKASDWPTVILDRLGMIWNDQNGGGTTDRPDSFRAAISDSEQQNIAKMIKTRQRTIVWNSDAVVRVLMWLEKSSSHVFVCVIAKKRK